MPVFYALNLAKKIETKKNPPKRVKRFLIIMRVINDRVIFKLSKMMMRLRIKIIGKN